MKRYLRKGPWCACLRSCNADKGQLEDGLSVFECEPTGEGWRPLGPAWEKRRRQVPSNHVAGIRPWYLVEGHEIGTGGDREPLLSDVSVVSSLRWDKDASFFIESNGAAPSTCNHPGYPDCKCESRESLLGHDVDGATLPDEDPSATT